jgi:hypothetical protein
MLVGVAASSLAIAADNPAAAGDPAPQVIAYYFHTDYRCSTCRTIEAYSEEAITAGFEKELAAGALEWRVVNMDKPENKHFVQDFQLVTKSLVLVEEVSGKVVRFENLEKVWLLTRDKDAFLDYVRGATREILGEGRWSRAPWRWCRPCGWAS